jgi:uncharacterized membrane protein
LPRTPSPDKPAAAVPELAARNIETIATLEREALHERSRLDRFTGAITRAAGSPVFIVAHAVWFAGWLTFNSMSAQPFDPYPFGLLMMIVSLEAIFLSTAVLMTQNRMQRQADKRAHLDLQVNLLAEQELTAILQLLTRVSERLGVAAGVPRAEVEQLLKETDIHRLSVALDQELDGATEPAGSAPAPHTLSPRRS